jgi:hypothetical protein
VEYCRRSEAWKSRNWIEGTEVIIDRERGVLSTERGLEIEELDRGAGGFEESWILSHGGQPKGRDWKGERLINRKRVYQSSCSCTRDVIDR